MRAETGRDGFQMAEGMQNGVDATWFCGVIPGPGPAHQNWWLNDKHSVADAEEAGGLFL